MPPRPWLSDQSPFKTYSSSPFSTPFPSINPFPCPSDEHEISVINTGAQSASNHGTQPSPPPSPIVTPRLLNRHRIVPVSFPSPLSTAHRTRSVSVRRSNGSRWHRTTVLSKVTGVGPGHAVPPPDVTTRIFLSPLSRIQSPVVQCPPPVVPCRAVRCPVPRPPLFRVRRVAVRCPVSCRLLPVSRRPLSRVLPSVLPCRAIRCPVPRPPLSRVRRVAVRCPVSRRPLSRVLPSVVPCPAACYPCPVVRCPCPAARCPCPAARCSVSRRPFSRVPPPVVPCPAVRCPCPAVRCPCPVARCSLSHRLLSLSCRPLSHVPSPSDPPSPLGSGPTLRNAR